MNKLEKKLNKLAKFNIRYEIKSIIKLAGFLVVLSIIFMLLTTPANHWLPFHRDFPSWMVEVAPITYIYPILAVFGLLLILAVIIWFIKKLGENFD